MMNAELTAENRPACIALGSTFGGEDEIRTTHEDKRSVQVLVVFSRIIPVKLSRFPAVHCIEVGSRVVGSQRIEEFFEGGMQAVWGRVITSTSSRLRQTR